MILYLLNRSKHAIALTISLCAMAFATPVLAKDGAKLTGAAGSKYKAWVKLCPKQLNKKKKVCMTRADAFDTASMIPYAPIMVEEIEGKKPSIFVTLPHVWMVKVERMNKKTKKKERGLGRVAARWNILSGAIIKVDENKVHKLRYIYCDQLQCVAQVIATDTILGELKKGKRVYLAGMNGRKPLGRPFTLTGFNKALTGKPDDENAYNQLWKKRLTDIRNRQLSFRKKQIAAMKKKQAAQKKK